MEALNLWELMGMATTSHPSQTKRGKIEDMIAALGATSYVAGQELSIEVAKEGWLIKVFSCYDSSWEINILIGSNGKVDVSVGRTETSDVGSNRQ